MGFASDLEKICAKTISKSEDVVRRASLDLYQQMVDKSPVGDPSQWKENAEVMAARTAYAEAATAYNAANPGKRRQGTSKATLDKKFKLKSFNGYVGGRFKNNWQAGIGSINTGTSRPPDKTGAGSMAAFSASIRAWEPGQTIYLTNSLPYAYRLEHGWSKQTPNGMVRLSVQNFNQALAKAANEVK